MTFMENLSWFVMIFFFVFAIFDIAIRFSRYYKPLATNAKSNHPDKSKMFFDDDTREALK